MEVQSDTFSTNDHILSRFKRQSSFNNEIIDSEDRVCLPRYECDKQQKSSSLDTFKDAGFVQKNHFKSSYLIKKVKFF